MVNLTYFTPMVLAGVGQFGTAPLNVGSQYVPSITVHSLIDNHNTATSEIGATNGDLLYANILDYDGYPNYVTAPTNPWGSGIFRNSNGNTGVPSFPDIGETGGTFPNRITYGAIVSDAEECATRCMAHDLCMGFQFSDPTAPGATSIYPNSCGLLMRMSLTSNEDGDKAEANIYLRNTFPNGWEPTRMQVGYDCDGTPHATDRDATAPMTVEKCKDFCMPSITERAVITGTDECHCFNLTECSSPIEFDGSGTPNNAQRTRASVRWYDYDMVLDYTPGPTVSPTVTPTVTPTKTPTASPTVYTTYAYDQMTSGGNLVGSNPHVRSCWDPRVGEISDRSLVSDISISDIYYFYGMDSNGQYNYITQSELDSAGQDQYTESLWSDNGFQPDPRDLSFSVGVGQAACEEECNKADKCIGYTVHRSNADCRLLTHCKGRGRGAQTNTDVYARKSFRYGWEAEEVATGATCDGGNLFFGPSDFGTGEPVTPEQCFNHCQGLFGITYISIDDLRCSCWRTCPAYANDDRFVTYKVKAADVIAPQPTTAPTKNPTKSPSKTPTKAPTKTPTGSPTTPIPTKSPTTPEPTGAPTTPDPTTNPTKAPSKNPTKAPTRAPSKNPTRAPTRSPSKNPTRAPSKKPTNAPTRSPTKSPTTPSPTKSPSPRPTGAPTESTELATTIIPGAAVGGGVLAIIAVVYFRYYYKGGSGDGGNSSNYTPGRRVEPQF